MMEKSCHGDDRVGWTLSIPFPISCIYSGGSKRYMLYDANLIAWLRREHHILGVLIGSLPQAPSQNIFLGLPLELMAEEARLLVEKKLASITDDRTWHMHALQNGVPTSKVKDYRTQLLQRGLEAAEVAKIAKEAKYEEVMKRLNLNDGAKHKLKMNINDFISEHSLTSNDAFREADDVPIVSSQPVEKPLLESFAITPTISGCLSSEHQLFELPDVDSSSYALFKMLHNKGYFLSPGLRFGCQYMAYPGDPLRYHSHFLVVASDWDKSINLIDIIGSGRLATGVKKSFLLGGIEPRTSKQQSTTTRAFSIEWAGM